MTDWLIDDGLWSARASELSLESELGAVRRSRGRAQTYAIRLGDLIIHRNQKLFGEADIRVDALVVHGRGRKDNPASYYAPGTFRFGRVADGDRLPIEESGLLVFLGKPRHFLDIFITVSRDTRDTDELATLLTSPARAPEISAAAGDLYRLTGGPEAAALSAALQAALSLGDIAYRALRTATNKTVGLYRASWLQHRDNFGEGRHPDAGHRREKDLSFWYEVIPESAPAG